MPIALYALPASIFNTAVQNQLLQHVHVLAALCTPLAALPFPPPPHTHWTERTSSIIRPRTGHLDHRCFSASKVSQHPLLAAALLLPACCTDGLLRHVLYVGFFSASFWLCNIEQRC